MPMTVDDLAQEIRRVDGNHSIGAGALAEALLPFIERHIEARELAAVAYVVDENERRGTSFEHPAAADAQGDAMDRIMTYAKELRASDAAGEAANWRREYDELMSRKPEGADADAQGVEALLRSENPDRKDFTLDEALSIADKHEAAHRHVPSVSRTLAAEVRRLTASAAVKESLTTDARAQKPSLPETPDSSFSKPVAIGRCCYGGMRSKTNCASCAAWQPDAQRGDDREDAERWREVARRYDASKTQDAVAVLRGLGLEETPYRSFAENIDAARAATHDSAGGA